MKDKTQKLIERIELRRLGWAINSDITVKGQFLDDCKTQLTAQADEIKRLREGLKQILDAEYFVITIRDIAKQLLNNEVL